jgi:hypothetical protein
LDILCTNITETTQRELSSSEPPPFFNTDPVQVFMVHHVILDDDPMLDLDLSLPSLPSFGSIDPTDLDNFDINLEYFESEGEDIGLQWSENVYHVRWPGTQK